MYRDRNTYRHSDDPSFYFEFPFRTLPIKRFVVSVERPSLPLARLRSSVRSAIELASRSSLHGTKRRLSLAFSRLEARETNTRANERRGHCAKADRKCSGPVSAAVARNRIFP